MFRYLFRKPGAQPEVPPGSRAFSSHRNSPVLALLGVLCLAVVIETFAIHLLVGRWSRPAAWILTSLSLYSLLFLIAHGRALVLKPHLISEGRLLVRDGLLWSAEIPLDRITTVDRCDNTGGRRKDTLSATTLVQGNLALTADGGIDCTGPYGIRKRYTTVRFLADDPRALEAALTCSNTTPTA
jgi:hypothetical protein